MVVDMRINKIPNSHAGFVYCISHIKDSTQLPLSQSGALRIYTHPMKGKGYLQCLCTESLCDQMS